MTTATASLQIDRGVCATHSEHESPDFCPVLSKCFVVLQLFDAALVANGEHAASWHGWGLLEKRQGNFKKARDLWMKVHSHSHHT